MSGSARRTIFALSSGSPPAGIAVVRISGPDARAALEAIAGKLPPPRRASYRVLTHPETAETLDRALVLWFAGPSTATGEDVAELQLHGGRAVVNGVLAALEGISGLFPAEPGEFTRRAFDNGRIDLAEAEGLADLLTAETQAQRRAAIELIGGHLSRQVETWRGALLSISAQVEALLDFSDEDDVVDAAGEQITAGIRDLTDSIGGWLSRPEAERLKDGVTVAIAGPVNAGKSSLINALSSRDVAIASPVAGTTRDLVEASIALQGIPFRLIDTAGLRETDDAIETIGVARAQNAIDAADIIIWLGEPDRCPDLTRSIIVTTMADLGCLLRPGADVLISSSTGQGLGQLVGRLVTRASALIPQEGEIALNVRQRTHLLRVADSLEEAQRASDPIIVAEGLRMARQELDAITGRAGVEDMLDRLFGAFCIGK